MKDKLTQYIDLLFAGVPGSEDVKQEILQNTLDRYDDLIAQGKVPEAAYRLAISGIGDINEILGTPAEPTPASLPSPARQDSIFSEEDNDKKKLLRAIAVGLYIICPIPLLILAQLFVDNDMVAIIGVCILLIIVAFATVLIILGSPKDKDEEKNEETKDPQRRSIEKLISAIGVAVYFVLSFWSGAWHTTWVIFPLCWAIKGLINAILDYKEASKYEA